MSIINKPKVPSWQLRVIEERDQLKEKFEKLKEYLVRCESGLQDKPESKSYELMKVQFDAMGSYLQALEGRIKLFGGNK